MFFSLVKSSVTEEERKQIFAKEKRLAAKKEKQTKEAKKRKKWKEDQKRKKREIQEKVEKQLDHFRKELGGGEDGNVEHPPDRNMERRQKRVRIEDTTLKYTDLDNPTEHDDGQLTEGFRNDFDDDCNEFEMHVRVYKQLRKRSSHTGTGKLDGEGLARSEEEKGSEGGLVDHLEEKRAAEQFERTDECGCGVDLSCDFYFLIIAASRFALAYNHAYAITSPAPLT